MNQSDWKMNEDGQKNLLEPFPAKKKWRSGGHVQARPTEHPWENHDLSMFSVNFQWFWIVFYEKKVRKADLEQYLSVSQKNV